MANEDKHSKILRGLVLIHPPLKNSLFHDVMFWVLLCVNFLTVFL